MNRHQTFAIAAASSLLLIAAPAVTAADVMMVGKVVSIKVEPDGKSAVATLANVKDGKEVNVTVNDKATLDLFAGRRIVPGDEVRLSYDGGSGANLSKRFRKASGC
jgi:hypothetical protein